LAIGQPLLLLYVHANRKITMALEKVIYTAHAIATGGREGTAKTDDGKLSLKLDTPIEMGGKGDGTNPEQMFAVGYAACFIGALKFTAKAQKISLPAETSISADVAFGTRPNGAKGFNIQVAMAVTIPGMERDKAELLVQEAHQVCPYSNATRGNVDVALTVV
jgi:lipoyl-dependent peroxiredoxin